jgi:hypothetical protein
MLVLLFLVSSFKVHFQSTPDRGKTQDYYEYTVVSQKYTVAMQQWMSYVSPEVPWNMSN